MGAFVFLSMIKKTLRKEMTVYQFRLEMYVSYLKADE
jgi:hypothetical protein